MRTRFKLGMALGAVAFGLAAANPAKAALVNGGFEAFPDFTGYTIIGNDTIQASDFRVPAEGLVQAVLATGPAATTGGPANPSNAAAIAAFIGAGSVSGTEGSAIKQVYTTATSGDTITFKYDFATNESRPSANFNDFGFVSVNGVITKLADTTSAFVSPPAITGSGDNAGINGFAAETGYQMFTLTLGGAGSYTIAFGVMDVGDTTTDSVLLVDNLVATAGTGGGGGGGGAVPLPAGMYLMPLGLALAGLYSVKLRRTAAC